MLAIMLFAFGGFVLLFAFALDDWSESTSDGWRRTSFRVSLALILLDAIVDAVRFQRRLLTRSAAERGSDDRSVRTMFYRVVALIFLSFEALPQHLLGFFDNQFHGRSPDLPPTQ